jgi:hypothetical protein
MSVRGIDVILPRPVPAVEPISPGRSAAPHAPDRRSILAELRPACNPVLAYDADTAARDMGGQVAEWTIDHCFQPVRKH